MKNISTRNTPTYNNRNYFLDVVQEFITENRNVRTFHFSKTKNIYNFFGRNTLRNELFNLSTIRNIYFVICQQI